MYIIHNTQKTQLINVIIAVKIRKFFEYCNLYAHIDSNNKYKRSRV